MIYEYRVYEAAPGQMSTLIKVIETAMPYFKKHGMQVIGCWTTQQTISDGSNKLIYMLAFEDLAHLEKAWKAFRSDKDWLKAHEAFTQGGKVAYVTKFSNYTMAPTPYSPIQ